MKKFVVLLVVVAMTLISAMAYAAADVTLGGTVQVRSRDFSTLNLNDNSSAGNVRDTQERVELDVNAKVGDVKGKVAIWNDFDTWGRFETEQGTAIGGTNPSNPVGTTIGIREAWVSFNLPSLPINVTAGHQLLALGQGWFFRSMHYGSDAWVIANQSGNNTAAFVNVKIAEVNPALADDIDAYVLLDVFKLDDKNAVGIDLTSVKDRKASISANPGPNSIYQTTLPGNPNPFKDINLYNLSLNYNGAVGPLNLKGQVDFQAGKAANAVGGPDAKFKGNEIVVQGTLPVDPVTVNFTVARGSGDKAGSSDVKQFVTALDVDPHYTFLYEYKIAAPASNYLTGAKTSTHLGFANTTALNVGATFAATKSVTVGADFWLLRATEKVNDSNDIGQEVDVKLNWNLAENLSWNWVAGLFKPGDAMKAVSGGTTDNATGIQGILALKF